METRFKSFFVKVNKEDQLLFKQLYFHPEILYRIVSYNPIEYYDDIIYNKLILNNSFWQFLTFALNDDEFIFRLDDKILAAFETIIKDSIAFKTQFLAFLEQLKDKSDVSKRLRCHRFIYLIACRQEQLFHGADLQKRALEYDDDSANRVCFGISDFQLYLDPLNYISEECEIFQKIDENRFFVNKHFWQGKIKCGYNDSSQVELIDEDMYYYLVCNNLFLRKIDEKISRNDLSLESIEESMNIINYSIYIKTHLNQITSRYKLLMGLKKIASFDLDEARRLLNKLIECEKLLTNNHGLKLIKPASLNEQES